MRQITSQTPTHELERRLHEDCYPGWLDAQSISSGGAVTSVPYDPEIYPEQRLDRPNIPLEQTRTYRFTPEGLFFSGMRRRLGNALESQQAAAAFVDDFKERDPETGILLHQSIERRLENGQNIAIICPHLEANDVVISLAGLLVALGKKRYLERSDVLINKLMSRQIRHGKNVGRAVSQFTEVIWVSPQTESAEMHGIDEKLSQAINKPASEIALSRLREARQTGSGRIFSIAPTGTATDIDDRLGLQLKPISDSTLGLLERFDGMLTVGLARDPKTNFLNWDIGPLVDNPTPKGSGKRNRTDRLAFERTIVESLALSSYKITGRQANYKDAPVEL